MEDSQNIAILGAGPSGLFILKKLLERGQSNFNLTVFERKKQPGAGMPYSIDGANEEHITNVSGNEIPELVTDLAAWVKTVDRDTLLKFRIDPDNFNDYRVLPRRLFGCYLADQFNMLVRQLRDLGVKLVIHYDAFVTDIIDFPEHQHVAVEINGKERFDFDKVIICTGHHWPVTHEGTVPGWFDSPYPPQKLTIQTNEPVALKGASLTAIDALRTLARSNGKFTRNAAGKACYRLADDSKDFKIIMHSRNGLLPAVRIHLEDSHLKDAVLTPQQVHNNRQKNNGFLSLDFVFNEIFKKSFIERDPVFYNRVKDMTIEDFVSEMMTLRGSISPFDLLRGEYIEAEKSIARRQGIPWKEMLAVLSYAMNYPAKYFPAEDMQRLQKVLMPLISVVIAFLPQSSAEEMLALYDAGVLELVTVDNDSYVEPEPQGGATYYYSDVNGNKQAIYYKLYVDCTGQPHLPFNELPYPSLLAKGTVSQAKLQFQNVQAGREALTNGNDKVETDGKGNYYLHVPGIAINDHFQVIDAYGALNNRVYMMAVPYIGGFNPDYSGLDFCETAAKCIVDSLN